MPPLWPFTFEREPNFLCFSRFDFLSCVAFSFCYPLSGVSLVLSSAK